MSRRAWDSLGVLLGVAAFALLVVAGGRINGALFVALMLAMAAVAALETGRDQ